MSERVDTVLVAGYGEMGQRITVAFSGGGHRTLVLSRDPLQADN